LSLTYNTRLRAPSNILALTIAILSLVD